MLSENELLENPYDQFESWFGDACRAKVKTPNAMTLATATEDQFPSLRTVLLRKICRDGFTFFTRNDSHKVSDIENNPSVTLQLRWLPIHRVVTIKGTLVPSSTKENRNFFNSCNRQMKLASWLPPYSEIEDFDQYQEHLRRLEIQYDKAMIPMPDSWCGFVIKAVEFTFWQGRSDYIHDHFSYQLSDDGEWSISRLAP